jgi:hypothetical protein
LGKAIVFSCGVSLRLSRDDTSFPRREVVAEAGICVAGKVDIVLREVEDDIKAGRLRDMP